MKLIYLTNANLPTDWAHGVQIMKMCEAFVASGAEVVVVAPKRRTRIGDDPFDYYRVKRNFKIIKLPCLDLFVTNPSRLFFWLRSLSFLLAARIFLFFRRYDVLYTRDRYAGLLFKNFIFEVHDLPKNAGAGRLKPELRARALVVLTSLLKKKLVEAGVPADKILVAPDAVDLSVFGSVAEDKTELRNQLGLPLDKKIIFYHGSFFSHSWKGVDVLLESARHLPGDCLLVLVGGSVDEINQAKKIYLANNVLFIGHRPYREIPYYLKAADIMVLPNKKGDKVSEEYTSPMKLFEYMASGNPIIASDLPSIREILNKDSALLFEANNPVDLAEKINLLIDDPDLGRQIAGKAFQVVADYTWDKRAQNIINFIFYQNI